MKRLFNIALGFALLCAVVACQHQQKPTPDKATDKEQKTEKTDSTKQDRDSLNNKVGELDSAIVELQTELQNLKGNVKQLEAENDSLKTSVTDMQDTQTTSNCVAWVALVLAALSLVWQGIKLWKKEKFEEKVTKFLKTEDGKKLILSILKQEEEKYTGSTGTSSAGRTVISQHTQKEKSSTQDHQPSKSNPPTNAQDGYRQGETVDLGVGEQRGPAPKATRSSNTTNQAKGSAPTRKLYAKLNSGIMFTDVSEQNVEGSIFVISLKNDNEGTFTILDLSKIQSQNNWDSVIRIQGTRAKEAKNITKETVGTCKFLPEKKAWKVVRPLVLTLK